MSKNGQKTRVQYVNGERFLPIDAQVTGYLPYNPQEPAWKQTRTSLNLGQREKDIQGRCFLLADGNLLGLFSNSGLTSSFQVANASRILCKILLYDLDRDNIE